MELSNVQIVFRFSVFEFDIFYGENIYFNNFKLPLLKIVTGTYGCVYHHMCSLIRNIYTFASERDKSHNMFKLRPI